MKHFYFLLFFIFLFEVSSHSNSTYFNKYTEAFESNSFYPNLTQNYQFSSIKNSYIQQKKWVNYLLTKEFKKYGYKSTLTSKEEQELYNINNPIFGVILTKNSLYNFDIIYKKDFLNPFLTIKLGVKIKKDIKKEIENSYDLKNYIQKIYPIAEITDYKFKNLNNITYNDLIVSNIGQTQFIKGDRVYFKHVGNLNVKVKHDSKTNINSKTYTSEEILNQLKWIINRALINDWEIKKGNIIFLSSYIDKQPLEKGIYEIDFTNYSSILFEIR